MGVPDRSCTPTVWERVVAMLEPSVLLSSAMYRTYLIYLVSFTSLSNCAFLIYIHTLCRVE